MALEAQPPGRYQIEAELARGGMGVVYRARDRSTGRDVALKRMLESAASNRQAVRLFQREYHTLVQLQHPSIIEVYDYGVDGQGAYYTMELLDGHDLRELAPLRYQDACRYLRDVASSLALLHARRLVHRDVSARNVRLTGRGRAKLLDFGALATFGATGQVVGTPPVVPPEALSGQPLDQRADLYSLGALAYWLLTGRHAYPAQKLQMLPALWRQGEPPPPSRLVSGIPREIDQIVMSLLSLDAVSRPSSAAEAIERLNVVAALESEEVLEAGHGYLSNPRIVGRDRELVRLRRFLARVVGGQSASLLVEGEAGVGKTRLVEEIGVEGQLRGATVVRVDAEIQRGPYAMTRALVRSLFAELPELAIERGKQYATILGGAIPEFRAHFPGEEDSKDRHVDPSERRVRVQSALAEWFLAIAVDRPLVLVIDNAHGADEASLALFAALPRRQPKTALGVLATSRAGEEVLAPRTFSAFREVCSVVPLSSLGQQETIALAKALFGDVHNAGRLGQWMRQLTDGNPMQCLALAAQLISDGHIAYKDGAWLLPSELSREQLPGGMAQVLERRIARLGASAKQLAESLSVERGTLSLEQCSALAGMEGDELFSALDDLVEHGMLVSSDGEYRVSQTALQNYLRDHLDTARKRELHRRAAEFLLSRVDADPTTRTDAGWHLLRAGDESRGADILAAVGAGLVSTVEGLALAAPGLEAALEVYEKQGRSKWALLNVLEALTSAGWYVDRKYAERHGERTLELAMELSGLALASKLSPKLGSRVALTVGMGAAMARHRVERNRIDVPRFRKFHRVVAPTISTVGILIGVAANTFDTPAARKCLNRIGILRAFPASHIARVMYDYARYYTYVTEGRIGEARPIGLRVLTWFESEAGQKALGRSAAKALAGGMMTGLGSFDSVSGGESALAWADKLDALGLSFYRLMATQVRFMSHVHRGELAKAAPYREQLELNAIQGGTTWQTSVLIPMMLGLSYTASGEVARLRQCADELELLATEVPSLRNPAELLRGAYHLARGRPAESVELLENLSRKLPPREQMLWAYVRSIHVRALLAAGRAEDALRTAEQAATHLTAEDRRQGLLMLDLDLALSIAEAETGRTESAARRIEALLAEHEPKGIPLVVAALHEARARVARIARNDEAFVKHLERMGTWVRMTENAGLVARWKRLETEDATDAMAMSSSHSSQRTAYASAARTVLEQHIDLNERARVALQLLMQNASATRGYLYLGTPPNLDLTAQVPEDVPPSESILQRVRNLARAVHHATDVDASVGLTGTKGLTQTTDTSDEYGGEAATYLLVVPQAGMPKVVGAVALEVGFDSGDPVAYDLLEVIAESLADLRDRAGVDRQHATA